MDRVLGWFTKTMRRQIDNATPTIHPRLLAPKQAGQHRLNKINRHLRATSRVVMPLHHFPWMPLMPLNASDAPECPWCCCWASNQAKTRKCTQVLLHEFWVLGLWVLYSVVYTLGRIQHLILIMMNEVFHVWAFSLVPLLLFCSILLLLSIKISMPKPAEVGNCWAFGL